MQESNPIASPVNDCSSELVEPLSIVVDNRVSTDSVSEAFRIAEDFCDNAAKGEVDHQLRLILRTHSCTDLFKQSIYTSLHEMLNYRLLNSKTRWSLQVY